MKLIRDSSRYILLRDDGTHEDITRFIESEINARVDFQRQIDRAQNDHEKIASMELSTMKIRHMTMKRYLERLLRSSADFVESWAKGKELVGSAIKTRQDVATIQKWLKGFEDS